MSKFKNFLGQKLVIGNTEWDMKQVLVALVALIVLVLCIIGLVKMFIPDKDKSIGIDTPTIVGEDKKFLDIEFSDIRIEKTENLTHLMANLVNVGKTEFKESMVAIVFLDNGGKEIGRAQAFITNMGLNETIKIDVVIDPKYSNAYDFKIIKE